MSYLHNYYTAACARKGSGLGKDEHDATDLLLSFFGNLLSTHFLWRLRCTALIVSLFRTPRGGFKVAVFIWYVMVYCCLQEHLVSVQSPTYFWIPVSNFFFQFKQFPPSKFYIPFFLSWFKLSTQCCQIYEPCNYSQVSVTALEMSVIRFSCK